MVRAGGADRDRLVEVRERLDEDLDPDPRLADERDPRVADRLVLLRWVGVVCLLATVPVTLPTVADGGAEPPLEGPFRRRKRREGVQMRGSHDC